MDKVKKPSHYIHKGGIESIDYCKAVLDPNEFLGAMKFMVIKYVSRAGKKHGSPQIEDLKKADMYLGWAIGIDRRKDAK